MTKPTPLPRTRSSDAAAINQFNSFIYDVPQKPIPAKRPPKQQSPNELRSMLIDKLKIEYDTNSEMVTKITHTADFNSKYQTIDLLSILHHNKGQSAASIVESLNLLKRFGCILLREESSRPTNWRKIIPSQNRIFSYIQRLIGGIAVLSSMGYCKQDRNIHTNELYSISFPSYELEPNKNLVANIVVELALAIADVKLVAAGTHPDSANLRQILPSEYFSNGVNNNIYEQPLSSAPVAGVTCRKCGTKFKTANKNCLNCNAPLATPPPPIGQKPPIAQKPSVGIKEEPRCVVEIDKENYQRQQLQQLPVVNKQSFQTQINRMQKDLPSNMPRQPPTKIQQLSEENSQMVQEQDKKQMSDWEEKRRLENEKSEVEKRRLEQTRLYEEKKRLENKRLEEEQRRLEEEQRRLESKKDEEEKRRLENERIKEERKRLENFKLEQEKLRLANEAEKRRLEQEQEKMQKQKINAMKKREDAKILKQIKENGERNKNILKECLLEGFMAEEVRLALHLALPRTAVDAFQWIRTQLPNRLLTFEQSCKAFCKTMKPVVSKAEAYKFLLSPNPEKSFIETRRKQIESLVDDKPYLKEDILDALVKAEGDVNVAESYLLGKILNIRHFHPNRLQLYEDSIRNKDNHIDRKLRLVMSESQLSQEHASLLIVLVTSNDAYMVEDCEQAVRTCHTLQACTQYLQYECQICTEEFPKNRMMRFSEFCDCHLCMQCFARFIDNVVTSEGVRKWVCPLCSLPVIEDVMHTTYFPKKEEQINNLKHEQMLTQDIHDMFSQKLAEFTYLKEDTFRWCLTCPGYGFLWDNNRNPKMVCDKCDTKMCFNCKEIWLPAHDGISCEQFKQWKQDNEMQDQYVANILDKIGFKCPGCDFQFVLAKGGCMHFKCNQCGYEFCIGCFSAFLNAAQCTVHATCAGKGLHAHHPRNCLYFLRDLSVQKLTQLLANVDHAINQPEQGTCGVLITVEEEGGQVEQPCGKNKYADGTGGLCELHYKEVLVSMINKHQVDPIQVMMVDELNSLLDRSFVPRLAKQPNQTDPQFADALQKYALERIAYQPLENSVV